MQLSETGNAIKTSLGPVPFSESDFEKVFTKKRMVGVTGEVRVEGEDKKDFLRFYKDLKQLIKQGIRIKAQLPTQFPRESQHEEELLENEQNEVKMKYQLAKSVVKGIREKKETKKAKQFGYAQK